MNEMNDANYFLFKSEKKTDEGHLKQMGEGPRYFFLFGLMFSVYLIALARLLPSAFDN